MDPEQRKARVVTIGASKQFDHSSCMLTRVMIGTWARLGSAPTDDGVILIRSPDEGRRIKANCLLRVRARSHATIAI
jgi:hypothetical protein